MQAFSANKRQDLSGGDRTDRIIKKCFFGDKPTDNRLMTSRPPVRDTSGGQSSMARMAANGHIQRPQPQQQPSLLSGSGQAFSGRSLTTQSSYHTLKGSQLSSNTSSMARMSALVGHNRQQSTGQPFFGQSMSGGSTSTGKESLSRQLFTNQELMNQILESNRDKEIIESVDQKMTRFTQLLSDIKSGTDVWPQLIEKTVAECVVREFDDKVLSLADELRRTREENHSLREELFEIKCSRESERESGVRHQQLVDDLRREIRDALPAVDYRSVAASSARQSREELNRCLNDYFDKIVANLRSIRVNSDSNDTEMDVMEEIQWFDCIE